MKILLVGGFLGSGKTTAVVGAAKLLAGKGRQSAVITNDQGTLQVDKEWVRSHNIPVEDVSNGCFCCQHNELLDRLELLKAYHPDFIFAESVGSCTDLVATVAKPLKVHLPDSEVIISVFADAALLVAVMQGNASFLSDDVRYIYQKQLEEADLILVNKIDLVSKDELKLLETILTKEYPSKKILYVSATERNDLTRWLNEVENFVQPAKRTTLELDYDRYAEGEADLAWLDEHMEIESEFADAGVIAKGIMNEIYSTLHHLNLTIGHLKFFLEGEGWAKKVSFTITQQEQPDAFKLPLARRVRLMINARIQVDANRLRAIVKEAISKATNHPGVRVSVLELTAFEPGYPKPTYRMS